MGAQHHLPTRPVDRDKAEAELVLNIKKATSPEETAPKQKHVRSGFNHGLALDYLLTRNLECIVYTWDYHSSNSIWTGLKVQPILSDEVQTFKALITVHKILQEGHPVVCPRNHTSAHRLKALIDSKGGSAASRMV